MLYAYIGVLFAAPVSLPFFCYSFVLVALSAAVGTLYLCVRLVLCQVCHLDEQGGLYVIKFFIFPLLF